MCLALRPGYIAPAPDECHVLVCQRTIGTRNEIGSSPHVRMCECFNDFFFFFYTSFFALYLPYVLLLLFKVPYIQETYNLFSCVLKNALLERILKFTARFFPSLNIKRN